jgi:hypothetical protein
MFGFDNGPSILIWVVPWIVLVIVVWRGRGKHVPGTAIVLTKFEINEHFSGGPVLEIAGRVSGLISWVLAALRLSPEVEFTVADTAVTIRTANLSGLQYIYIPLGKVTASVCGYQRSILAFGFALLFTLDFILSLLSGFLGSNRNESAADMGRAFGFLVLAAIAALVYYLSKKIAIAVESMHTHGIAFKQSILGNVSVDLDQALRATELINARIQAAQVVTVNAAESPSPAQPLKMAAAAPVAERCPQCSAENPIGTRFCESCGSALGR